LDIVKAVLNFCPDATLRPDMYGLTPIDWLWLCHVVDWNFDDGADSPIPDFHVERFATWADRPNHDAQVYRTMSRRRNLGGSSFLKWFQNAEAALLTHCLDLETSTATNEQPAPKDGLFQRCRHDYLLRFLMERLQLLLPVAADLVVQQQLCDGSCYAETNVQWQRHSTVYHAACFVRCPSALLYGAKLIIMSNSDSLSTSPPMNKIDHDEQDGNATSKIHQQDQLWGRHPLHYAACRLDYTANLPVRPSLSYRGGIRTHYEPSPIHTMLQCFPQAASEIDFEGRLPIHIVIDTMYRTRARNEIVSDEIENQLLQCLLQANPKSIEQKDGRTKLYPWQQAAVGDYANLNTIFILLRMQPTLLC
jgi:hypothetical protein